VTAVKICGLTRPEDVALAAGLGAAYLGFNFARRSPRRVSVEQGRVLSAGAPAGVLRVGVFGDEPMEEVARTVEAVRLDLVQLHRTLTGEDLAGSPVPIVAVARVSGGTLRAPRQELLVRCHALLVDSSEGTGKPFDVDGVLIERASWPAPVLLAGGLDPDNVGALVRRLRPAGVDVATGVEAAPGIKDRERLERFFAAVREADREEG
jgi:phosphoribosylanthranilate isomerase